MSVLIAGKSQQQQLDHSNGTMRVGVSLIEQKNVMLTMWWTGRTGRRGRASNQQLWVLWEGQADLENGKSWLPATPGGILFSLSFHSLHSFHHRPKLRKWSPRVKSRGVRNDMGVLVWRRESGVAWKESQPISEQCPEYVFHGFLKFKKTTYELSLGVPIRKLHGLRHCLNISH